jgi:hypothetical protein
MQQPFKVRLYAIVREISPPFDADRFVELKLELDRQCPYEGELRIRVAAHEAVNFVVGDCFSFKLTKVD